MLVEWYTGMFSRTVCMQHVARERPGGEEGIRGRISQVIHALTPIDRRYHTAAVPVYIYMGVNCRQPLPMLQCTDHNMTRYSLENRTIIVGVRHAYKALHSAGGFHRPLRSPTRKKRTKCEWIKRTKSSTILGATDDLQMPRAQCSRKTTRTPKKDYSSKRARAGNYPIQAAAITLASRRRSYS